MVTNKSRENRARRVAERRGFRLEKSRRRDPRSVGYGQYQLIDPSTGANVFLGGFGSRWATWRTSWRS